MKSGVSHKIELRKKFGVRSKSSGDANSAARWEILALSVCKKRLAVRVRPSRTVNQHRWTGGVP